jgi:hypothetical protein
VATPSDSALLNPIGLGVLLLGLPR